MLDARQRAEFETQGFVHLRGAFPREAAEAMVARIWRWLGKEYGARRDDPSSWDVRLVTGMQHLKREAIFDPIGGDVLRGALDDLVGPGCWQVPRDWGQFLVGFPTADETWRIPSRPWHTDYDFRGSFAPPKGALVLSFLSDVPAGGGGTLAVSGSHRLVRDFVAARASAGREPMKTTRTALLASDPWLRELSSPEPAPDRTERLMGRETEVRGIPLRVVELSAAAGDVVVGHPWLLHNASPNCGAGPRLMRVQRIARAGSAISVASAT